MARTHSQPISRASARKIRKEKLQKTALCILGVLTGAAAVATHIAPHIDKKPIHTSVLTGQKWLDELMIGHPVRFRRMMGMNRHVFRRLVQELEKRTGLAPTRYITAEEQLAIFLRIARTGQGNIEMQERFQRSGDTISKCFHRILNMLVSKEFYGTYVRLPPNEVPTEILENPKFFPYFQDCRGALDGSLLEAFVSKEDMAKYRSRKGFISTNLLAACTFDLRFCYLLSGWEGSAADARVYHEARRDDFLIEPGTYYLGDAGFPLCDTVLVPYRNVRYHLKEWEQASLRPVNYKELFNLRHAQLRNVIERIFGVCKRHFRLMTAGAEYNTQTQSKIPAALAVLHNFVRTFDPEDLAEENDGNSFGDEFLPPIIPSTPKNRGTHINAEESQRAADKREQIAKAMWNDYVAEQERRGI